MERPDRWAVLAVLGGVVSVQLGQALGKGLFGMAGPLGVATVRLVIAAVLMLALWRPALPQAGRDRWLILALGTSIAGMSIGYLAMRRLPFGVAMTLQLLGPVGVALGASRRAAELGWALLAAGSVVLFADPWSAARPPVAGLAYGLASAVAMALFLVLSGRLAARTAGSGGLALATAWAALLYVPLGLAESGTRLFHPAMAGMGAAVAVLSVVVPYVLTVAALRRLPLRLVSVLTSLEPVVAGLAGRVVLGEHLSATQWVAIGGVTVASAGATRSTSSGASAGHGRPGHGARTARRGRTMSPRSMSVDERERFLADAHIGVLSVVVPWEATPLVTPVWFVYEPGGAVRLSPQRDQRALECVRRTGRATLTVQEEPLPHRMVSVGGHVIVYEPTDPADLRQWAVRCLGDDAGRRYYHDLEDDLEHLTTVRLLPEHWRTCDLTPLLGRT